MLLFVVTGGCDNEQYKFIDIVVMYWSILQLAVRTVLQIQQTTQYSSGITHTSYNMQAIKHSLWILVLIVSLLVRHVSGSANVSPSELQALNDLYDSTDGANWLWRDSAGAVWNFTVPDPNPCDPVWQGVTCLCESNCSIQKLDLSAYGLLGSLPNSIGYLVDLIQLELQYNKLKSSIPESMGALILMKDFGLKYNDLTGTLPTCICNMTLLYNLNFAYNFLSGTIPECFANLRQLRDLFLNANNLEGSIPNCLVLLNRTLVSIVLFDNRLTGSIPPNLLNASGSVLRNINIGYNYLTGVFPPIESQTIYVVSMSNNLISGSIPSLSMGTVLSELYLMDNLFTGSFPNLLDLKDLIAVGVSYNQLSGSVPAANTVFPLVYILNDNLFSGTIPASICNTSFIHLEFSANFLHGSFPNCVLDTDMRYFSISENYFSGFAGNFSNETPRLEFFDCSYNKLTGKLPLLTGYNRHSLVYYYIQNNDFVDATSSFGEFGSASAIQCLDVSNNQLFGTIPDISAIADSLVSFAMGSNCLTGSIPSLLCGASNLLFLDLDGVSTAESCRTPIFPGINFLNSYYLKNQMTGGIPDCLFQLPLLETLHLSGNGIEWSFPNNFKVTEALTDLTLSHNRITGDISYAIQHRQWKKLDLSYNKLSGALTMFEQDDASVVLQVNRLSGEIPSSLLHLNSINVLTGNLFNCDLQRQQLPVNDPAYKTYQCGSTGLEESIIIWVCFCFSFAALVVSIVCCRYYWHTQFDMWFKVMWNRIEGFFLVFNNDNDMLLPSFYSYTETISRSLILLTCFIVVVFLPLYAVLKVYYGSVKYQYAWIVSAAYMSGEIPGIVLMVAYMVVISLAFSMGISAIKKASSESSRKYSMGRVAILSLVVLINCIVMLVVNGAYVLVAARYSTIVIFSSQICIALFKLLWNGYVLKQIILHLGSIFKSSKDDSLLVKDTEKLFEVHESLPFLSFIVLFNIIVAPCLATAAVDSNCFLNVFVPPPTVSTEFPTVIEDCGYNATLGGRSCTEEITNSPVSYDPPFTYNYQCSSAILTNYASVYVFMFLMVAFLKPLTLFGLMYLNAMVKGTRWQFLINSLLSRIMRPASEEVLESKSVLFHKEAFVLRCVGKLAVFATFGVVFPILTVVICVAFISEVCFNQLIMGRYIAGVDNEELRSRIAKRVGQDCQGCWDLLRQPLMTLVIPFAAFFYAFFVFDTYGDAVGYKRALWAPAVVTAYPWILRLVQKIHVWTTKQISTEKSSEAMEIDMTVL